MVFFFPNIILNVTCFARLFFFLLLITLALKLISHRLLITTSDYLDSLNSSTVILFVCDFFQLVSEFLVFLLQLLDQGM